MQSGNKLVARGVVLKGHCGVTVPFKALGVLTPLQYGYLKKTHI